MNIKELLYRTESDSLDFKEEQYKFINENNKHIKGELLKDILAFANAWRDNDAYILIGIKENNSSKHEIIGITEHIDDASLQEFINSKTNKAIKFEYGTIILEKKQIAYIKILTQKRPFYIKKDYGKVKANTVYLRRGSATVIANPDEISDMGEASIKKNNILQNPVNYTITAELLPLNLDSEKEIIHNKILKAKGELITLNENTSRAFNTSYPNLAIMRVKMKDKILYENELNSYKIELNKYIKHYNKKLKNFKYISKIYALELLIENIGNSSDTNIDINLNFSNGKLFKKTDLLSYFLDELHDKPYPKKPNIYYEEIKFNKISINNQFDYLKNISKIHNPNAFYKNITITDNNISVTIKDMNVGDNIYVLNEKLFFIADIEDLAINAIIKSNKSTSKITKKIDFELNKKTIDINNFFEDESK